MKKIKVISLLVAIFVLLSIWVPATNSIYPALNPREAAAAGTNVPLVITNPLPKATVVTLTGPTVMSINVAAGQTVNKSIPKASYKYAYSGCLGKKVMGPLKYKSGQYTIPIKPCKMATMTFLNLDSSHSYSLKMKGWMSYNTTVGPNQMKVVQFVADVYDITENICGNTYSARVKVSGKRLIVLRKC